MTTRIRPLDILFPDNSLKSSAKSAVRAIFGYGNSLGVWGLNITNLVNNYGGVATDITIVGTSRNAVAAAGFGGDKAIFGYGRPTPEIETAVTNLVSNLGVVATDTAGVGTTRFNLAAAGYGGDKAIFGYGRRYINPSYIDLDAINLVSNTGVLASDVTGVGTSRSYLAAAGYGGDKAIFGYGTIISGQFLSVTNLVSNTGVVGTDVAGVGTSRNSLAAAGYGGDKAIFGYGQRTISPTTVNIINLVSNLGIVAADTSGVGTARYQLAAAGYGGDKAIFGYGYSGESGSPLYLSLINLVSNTGIVAADSVGVGTGRASLAAASYSS
jgi:hypothetical protein